MIDFNQVPKVAIGFMNDDHSLFTDLVNQLEALLTEDGSEVDSITFLMEELLDHCREHFGREEQQMSLFHFPPYPVHKGEHERVVAELELVINQWRTSQDRDTLRRYVEALPQWFINHAATMDTVTASYIVRMGGPVEPGVPS